MNDIQVVLRGNLASDPRLMQFDDGKKVTSFRLASTSSWFDREHSVWVDRRTTFVSVNCRRALANSAMQSLRKGHPVVITGRLWERSWVKEDRSGRTLEVEAETIGHDLTFGISAFTRFARPAQEQSAGEEKVGIETSTPEAAAVYEAVREIQAPVADVSGFPVLEDGDDSFGTDDPLGDTVSASQPR